MVAKRILITNSARIPEILDLIHDCWFDTDKIEFDREESELLIPFERAAQEPGIFRGGILPFGRRNSSMVLAYLRIRHVENYHLNDLEGLGTYDFNEIHYDENSSRLRITTGVPLEFEVKVKRFELEVEVTEDLTDPTS